MKADAKQRIKLKKAGLALRTYLALALVVSSLYSITVPAHADLAAAILPSARSAVVGTPVTVFATVINAAVQTPVDDDGHSALDPPTALDCRISLATDLPVHFTYQTTDPLTNAVTGEPNQPVAIAAGAAQSFVLSLEPWTEIAPVEVEFLFGCSDIKPAQIVAGVNTLALSASLTQVPDLIVHPSSVTGAGVVLLDAGSDNQVTGATRYKGAFSLAAVNIGSAGNELYLRAESSADAKLALCETNPATGACTQPPSEGLLATAVSAGAFATYSVFVETAHQLGFDPAASRVALQFIDTDGTLRGATSTALANRPRNWLVWRDSTDGVDVLRVTGEVVAPNHCHQAEMVVAPGQADVGDYLTLAVQLASTLSTGQVCNQSLAKVPVDFTLPEYTGSYVGVVIRRPNATPLVVDILHNL